jgi:hypothetical protein
LNEPHSHSEIENARNDLIVVEAHQKTI